MGDITNTTTSQYDQATGYTGVSAGILPPVLGQSTTVAGVQYVAFSNKDGNMEWKNATTDQPVVIADGTAYASFVDANGNTQWTNLTTGGQVPPNSDVAKLLNPIGVQGTGIPPDLDSDSIGIFDSTTYDFTPPTTPKDASNPNLPPPNEDDIPDVLPYGKVEQKMVKEFFTNQVTSMLRDIGELPRNDAEKILESILTGVPCDDPDLQHIADRIKAQATENTIELCNLPSTWTPQSTSATDWTPLPGVPMEQDEQGDVNKSYDDSLAGKINDYIQNNNLTPEQAANLKSAAAGGKVTSDIADAFNQLSKAATIETQDKYGLSSTWFRGTPFVDSWIPVNASVINPKSVNSARIDSMIYHLDQIGESIQKAGQTLLDGMPDGPNKVAMTEFLKIIGDAIKELKATLRSLSRGDALVSEKETKGKMSALADKRLRMEEQSKKTEDSIKKELEVKSQGMSMKIVGPIIAAFLTLAAAIIAIVSLGTATEVSVAMIIAAVAVIVVGIAMTTYSVVDSATDCTSKISKAMNEAIEKSLKNAPEWAKSLVKALIILAMVLVLIVVLVASGGTEGGNVGEIGGEVAQQTAAQTVKALVQEIMKQLSIQLIVMIIMSSNVVPELVGNVLKAAGVDSKVVQAIQMVVMAVMMIACIMVMNKMMTGASKEAMEVEKTAETAAKAAPSAMSASERASAAIKNMFVQVIKAGSDIEQFVEQIKELPARAKQACMDAVRSGDELAESIGKSLDETFTSIFASLKDSPLKAAADAAKAAGSGIYETGKTIKDMSRTEKTLMFVTTAAEIPAIVGGAIQGAQLLRVAKILKEAGEIDASIQLLEGMIKALEGLLKNLQGGMSSRDDFILELQNNYKGLYDKATASYGQVARASIPA